MAPSGASFAQATATGVTATVSHRGYRTAYTIALGRHQLRLGPIAFWIVVGTLVIMAGWTIMTATYFAFHDDLSDPARLTPGSDAGRL